MTTKGEGGLRIPKKLTAWFMDDPLSYLCIRPSFSQLTFWEGSRLKTLSYGQLRCTLFSPVDPIFIREYDQDVNRGFLRAAKYASLFFCDVVLGPFERVDIQ